MIFRGREATHPELAINLLKKVSEQVEDIAGIDVAPQLEGRGMSMILAPLKRKHAAPAKQVEAPLEASLDEPAAVPDEQAEETTVVAASTDQA